MRHVRTPADLLKHRPGLYEKMDGSEEKLRNALRELEIALPHKSRKIQAFKWYWGFTEEGSLTLREIGERLGVGEERARQLRVWTERVLPRPDRWKIY